MTAVSDEKFPPGEHILKTGDFRNIYHNGLSFRKGAFILYTLPTGSPGNRIGFSVSARAVKRATKRNRIKRLLREAYRKSRRSLKNGFDMVVTVKRDIGHAASFKDVNGIFVKLANESGILQ